VLDSGQLQLETHAACGCLTIAQLRACANGRACATFGTDCILVIRDSFLVCMDAKEVLLVCLQSYKGGAKGGGKPSGSDK
jgi:hypothetical protein